MSRSFSRILLSGYKYFIPESMFYRKNDNQFNAFVLWLKTIGLTTVTASHCVYALSTSKML